jgi:hypothetical protein
MLYLGFGNPLHKIADRFVPASDPLDLTVCIFGALVASAFLANSLIRAKFLW